MSELFYDSTNVFDGCSASRGGIIGIMITCEQQKYIIDLTSKKFYRSRYARQQLGFKNLHVQAGNYWTQIISHAGTNNLFEKPITECKKIISQTKLHQIYKSNKRDLKYCFCKMIEKKIKKVMHWNLC